MKIYFAGSIRGGRDDSEIYFKIIEMLQVTGADVLTEHIGSSELTSHGETTRTNEDIFDRDMEWVREADVVVAEVTQPSLGVGYELGQAEALGKPILCLYRQQEGKRLSAMLAGNPYPRIAIYQTLEEAKQACDFFLKENGI